jgi:DNA-binding NarL/FixJ family response regulator
MNANNVRLHHHPETVMELESASPVKKRIFIVDDHAMFRDGLRRLIELEPDLTVCGDARDAQSGLQGLGETLPDLVVAEISPDPTKGMDLIKTIKRYHDDVPVLVVSMHPESLCGDRALQAGAMGYVMKSEPATTMVTAIRKVLSGNIHISEKMTTLLVSKLVKVGQSRIPLPLETLSNRESEVFRMLGKGKGTREIARELNVALPTISSFKNRIREKLNFKNSTEMILCARHRNGTPGIGSEGCPVRSKAHKSSVVFPSGRQQTHR